MKKNHFLFYALGAIAIVAAVVFLAISIRQQAVFDSQNALITIDRPELGLEFGYTAGPDALSMVEPPVSGIPLEAAFIIMPSDKFVAFSNGEIEEVGPTISLFVFRYSDQEMSSTTEALSKSEKLMAWAQENQALTGINEPTTDVVDYELDDLKGISYETESVYKQDIKLFRIGDRHYMFVGQSEPGFGDMSKHYEDVLRTVRFN